MRKKVPLYYWIFLVGAILSEVIGTLAMRFSILEKPWLGLSIMYIMVIISYCTLAIAIQRIPLAVAYGAWESLGLVIITLSSALLFSEPLNLVKVFSIGTIIVGIILVDRGSVQKT